MGASVSQQFQTVFQAVVGSFNNGKSPQQDDGSWPTGGGRILKIQWGLDFAKTATRSAFTYSRSKRLHPHIPSYSTTPTSSILSISRTFSADINDAFSMDKNLDGLVQSVEQKKQAVSSEIEELVALEAKLKETEEKLKQKQASPAASKVNDGGQQQQIPPPTYDSQAHINPSASHTATSEEGTGTSASQAPAASTMSYWRPPMPGALPETPGDSRQNSYLGGSQNNR
ncbi:MAG: hypothetical protein Q9213_007674 [Squamulea squamosa]